jgi:hypothetical protein
MLPFRIPDQFEFVRVRGIRGDVQEVMNLPRRRNTVYTYTVDTPGPTALDCVGDFVRIVPTQRSNSRIAMNVFVGPGEHSMMTFPVNDWFPLLHAKFMGGLWVTGAATVEFAVISDADDHRVYIGEASTQRFSLAHGFIVGGSGILGTRDFYNDFKFMF